jgi:predicted GNAT family acetyltransferase
MIVYEVSPVEDTGNGFYACTTQRAAFAMARGIARGGTEATVRRVTITTALRGRALACALLNNVGFAAENDLLKTFPAAEQEWPE